MSWRMELIVRDVPMPDWIADEATADEIGPMGLRDLVNEDPISVLAEFIPEDGSFADLIRFFKAAP